MRHTGARLLRRCACGFVWTQDRWDEAASNSHHHIAVFWEGLEMKRPLVVCALVGSVLSVQAQAGPPADVASQTTGAGRVVVARVATVHAQFETSQFGDQLIVSHAVLEVLETLKGAPAATLTVAVEGGTVGDLTLKVSDLPSLAEGERAMFFLDTAGAADHTPHRRGLGILKIDDHDRTEDGASLDDLRKQVHEAMPVRGGRR
jgi:hypothetical protein